MREGKVADARKGFAIVFVFLGLAMALVLLPYQFRSKAGSSQKKSNSPQVEKLSDFDIRNDKKSAEVLDGFRAAQNKTAVQMADQRDAFVEGENALKRSIPTLKVEYNKELGNPEVIAPDVMQGAGLMTAPSSAKRAEILRNFAKENNNLVGLSTEQLDNLRVTADYTNPNGELSFARLEQFVGDIPVFRAEIRAGFNKQGAMFRVVNNLASGADYNAVSENFGNPLAAVEKSADYINYQLKDSDRTFNSAASTDLKAVFGQGDWATTAEKMYFPIEGGVLRPSWRVLNWQKGDAYYVIVDAETGTMLYRENITHSQTQPATYNVYANTNSLLKVMGNPAPLAAPGLLDPALGTQGTLQPRTNVTVIGNEAPYTFNNNGWITDGANGVNGFTDGNNAEAGVDRVLPNGVDAPVAGTNRTFNFTYTLPAGPNNSGGDDPLTAAYQNGAGTNLFFVTNRYHDETYLLGFTEAARNFQNDNFGRGGAAADRISAEAQDNTQSASSCPTLPCFNNANFSTPADGGRGRMQMYLWNAPTPDRDGDFDAEIIVHELTHGLFGRLHNGTGGTQAGQMNEGNSDFFAHVLLSLDNDPINIVSTTGSYATLLLRGAGFTSNYYYGIRRFPKAVFSFTGGPNNRPHNPLTFKDIDPAQMSLTDGAFAPAFGGSATAVHDGGEIWSSMMWEVRARLVQRLGGPAGNKKVLQLAMDGMKVAPSNPTMIQERNAIIQAAQANGNGADVADIWAGFAVRGMGFSATGTTTNVIVEGYDLPNLVQTQNLTVSDAPGDNDGFPEPGESITISVPLTNSTGSSATGVTLQLVGGGSANYGTIANGATVTQALSYTVPLNTPCGTAITLTFNMNSSLGATSFTRTIIIGVPVQTFTENFDGAVAPAFPAGWTAVSVQSGIIFVNSPLNPDTAANSAFAADPIAVGGGSDLTSPSIPITSSAATVSFRNRFDTEGGWDGGVLEISVNGGTFQDIITAGGRFIQNGYNGALGAGANNPLANRNAWSGDSSGYITSTVQLPASAAGQNVQLKWRFGGDDNTAGTGPNSGWYVDTIRVNGTYACSTVTPPNAVESRGDFDNDGKTDLSVFRPSEGNWYLSQSTAGFGVIHWGVSSDVLTPGDFDGDGKTDLAIFRANPDSSQPDFYVLNSNGFTFSGASWGVAGDIPVVRDYDGDDKEDVAVFRPSDNTWYILKSSGGAIITTFGQAGDVPVAGDFDGDGKGDLTVYRSGAWISQGSLGGSFNTPLGAAGDVLVPADYDGDDKDDLAVFRPATGEWFVRQSTNAATITTNWGVAGDIPTPGDYDGDGKDDLAIYRNGQWWILRSQAGAVTANFGVSTDKAIPRSYVP
jgi:hypothetical protein